MATDAQRCVTLLLAVCLLAGCTAPGFLYTDITLPLTVDMNRTPRADDAALATQRSIREPITGAGIRAEWSDHSPGEMAQLGGLDRVSYADLHRHSFFGGIWGSATVLVYGKRDGVTAAATGSVSEAPRAQ